MIFGDMIWYHINSYDMIWYDMMYDVWYIICDIWHATYDMLHDMIWYQCLWNKHSSGEEGPWEDYLSKHEIIRGWRAAFAAGWHGRGSRRRNVFSQTPVSTSWIENAAASFWTNCICVSRYPQAICVSMSISANPRSLHIYPFKQAVELSSATWRDLRQPLSLCMYKCIYIYMYI